MGTFKCQACGNLHGAPVEACGMCGAASVVPVEQDSPADRIIDPGTNIADVLKPILNEVLKYIRAESDRAAQAKAELLGQTTTLDKLIAHESARLDRAAQAKAELLGQTTTLVDKLIELVEAITSKATSPVV